MNKDKIKWYIAGLIEVFEYNNSDRISACENYYLIEANSLKLAKNKAFKIGKSIDSVECSDEKGKKGYLRFYGISSITPIYDEIKDGTEILWTQYKKISKYQIKKIVKYPVPVS